MHEAVAFSGLEDRFRTMKGRRRLQYPQMSQKHDALAAIMNGIHFRSRSQGRKQIVFATLLFKAAKRGYNIILNDNMDMDSF
jgi:hypothetical protein